MKTPTPSSVNAVKREASLQARGVFGYVYITKNLANGKMYIGKKKSRNFIKTYFGSGTVLGRSIKKRGTNVFSVKPLSWASSIEELNALEIKLISSYRKKYGRKKLYNITDGGYGSGGYFHTKSAKEKIRAKAFGRTHTDATKKKIQLASLGKPAWNKGLPQTMQVKRKIHKALFGKVLSLSHRKNISDALKQNPLSAKAKRAISRALTGRHVSKETRKKLSKAGLGHSVSLATRQKISKAHLGVRSGMLGKHFSKASKIKMSLANKRFWEKKRALSVTIK